MGLNGILEAATEIQASPEKFYELFKTQIYHLPTISPDVVQSIELHEGEWHAHGALKLWTYNIGGKTLSAKERVEIDDENKMLKFNIVEGDILQEFKALHSTVQVIGKEDGSLGCLVKWVIEYEKLNEDVKDPDGYLELTVKMTKDAEIHLMNV